MDKLVAKIDVLISGQTMLREGFQSLELQQKNIIEKLELKLESKTVKLENEVADLKRKNIELETSLDFVSNQYDSMKTSHENVLKRINQIEKLHDDLKLQTDNLTRTTRFTSEMTDSVENQGRKMMVEIDGIPSQAEEQDDRDWCLKKVKAICNLIHLPDVKDDIDVVHRIKNGAIIVLFKNRTARNKLYFGRFSLKGKSIEDLGLAKPEGQKGLMWINESLSGRRKKLLADTKGNFTAAGCHIGKEGIGLYTSLGNITVRSNGRTYSINNEDDIKRAIHDIKNSK